MITLPVEQIGDDYFLTFTDDLLEELGWKVGDDLDWDLQSDGSILVTKHDEATSTSGFSCPPPSFEECADAIGSPVHDC